jgi:hypothetical protein
MVKFKVHLIQNDNLDGYALESGALGSHFLSALNALDGVAFPFPRYQNGINLAVICAGEDIDIIVDCVHHSRAPF